MQTSTNKNVVAYFILGVLVAALFAFTFISNMRLAVGSTITGNDYFATSTVAGVASATAPFVISNHVGALASIIVSSSSAQIGGAGSLIRFYDNAVSTGTMAQSSMSPGVAVSSSTVIVSMPSNTAVGTYTFDLITTKGLVVDVPVGFNGSWTVTYR